MSNYTIGLNGLWTAQKLIDLAGDNISNANTEGYHAKRATVAGIPGPTTLRFQGGLGSRVEDIYRLRNIVIEKTLLEHIQARERLGQEVESLEGLEQLFAEPSAEGLDAQLGAFFDSVASLAASPDDATLRESVVQKAVAVCNGFSRLDSGLSEAVRNSSQGIVNLVQEVNSLTEQVAYLNAQIQQIQASGSSAASHKDRRDQLISRLAEIINVETYEGGLGVTNVSCSGTLLVQGSTQVGLATSDSPEGIRIHPADDPSYRVDVREGRLGALLDQVNELLPGYRGMLDSLADDFRRAVNNVHTTSLGLNGRFSSLAGLNALDTDVPLSEIGWGVPASTDEKLYVNIEDVATGQVTQFELTLDTTVAARDFVADLRDAINTGVNRLDASVSGGKLLLQAQDGYRFGFATPYDPNPAAPGDITAGDPTIPAILDAYEGDRDLTYAVTFMDGGSVGEDAIDIRIDVSEPGGAVLRSLSRSIGADYQPGETVTLENGLKLSLGEGNVASGDSFSFTARADMDTGGVLDALGLNTFIRGQGAGALRVVERVLEDNARLAGALRPVDGDNHRFLQLAALRDGNVASGGARTVNGAYRDFMSEIATTRNVKSVQLQNEEKLVGSLQNRRDAASAVSVDEEMVNLVRARTLYQGSAKYIAAVDQMLQNIASIV